MDLRPTWLHEILYQQKEKEGKRQANTSIHCSPPDYRLDTEQWHHASHHAFLTCTLWFSSTWEPKYNLCPWSWICRSINEGSHGMHFPGSQCREYFWENQCIISWQVCISGRGNAMYSQLYKKVKVYHPNRGHPQSFMPSTECRRSCFALDLWCFGIPELLLSEEEISILLESLEKSALCLFLEGPRARSGFYRWVFTITFVTENTTLTILYFMCAGAPRTGAVLSHSCVRWEGNQTGPSTSASVFSFLSSL